MQIKEGVLRGSRWTPPPIPLILMKQGSPFNPQPPQRKISLNILTLSYLRMFYIHHLCSL